MEFDRIYAEVDLGRIEENMKAMKEHLRPGTKMYGVVKTDAYGHGAVPVARTIDRFVCGYAVATVDEGIKLRRHGIEKEILSLGPVSAGRYQECLENDISLPMFEYQRAKELSDAAVAEGKTAKIHIAVDTGMSRIGLFPDEGSVETVKEIAELPALRIDGTFTHFARADEADGSMRSVMLGRQREWKYRSATVPTAQESWSSRILTWTRSVRESRSTACTRRMR